MFGKLFPRAQLLVVPFFLLLIFLGAFCFRDYGTHWDELRNRDIGLRSLKIIEGTFPDLHFIDDEHGPAFELALSLVERAFHRDIKEDSRRLIQERHLLIYFFFLLGVAAFYKLLQDSFADTKLSLLGATFLVCSPRIFADAFYNTNDISFLVATIFASYTFSLLIRKKSFPLALLHGLSCGLATDIRIVGILSFCLTPALLLWEWLFSSKERRTSLIRLTWLVTGLSLSYVGTTLALWPFLWRDPLHNFVYALKNMGAMPWEHSVRYWGEFLPGTALPWHYNFLWIGISTPLLFLFLFLVGLSSSVAAFRRDRFGSSPRGIISLWMFLSLSIPLLAPILCHSVLFDGWRHHFFIYPALLFFSVKGVESLNQFRWKGASFLLSTMVGLQLLTTALFMIRAHPYQNVYFNSIGDSFPKNAFDLDYWGLSYREGLEKILSASSYEGILVYSDNIPGSQIAMILPKASRDRLVFVEDPEEADFFIGNYRWRDSEYTWGEEIFSLTIDSRKILSVRKKTSSPGSDA